MSSTERPSSGAPEQEIRGVRASDLLRTRTIWILPITLAYLAYAHWIFRGKASASVIYSSAPRS